MKVLLVDDEPLALRRLEDAVTAALPRAERFAYLQPQEALDFALKTPMDIAFLDISMRIVDGIAIARKLQMHYPRINIVFCTSYSGYAMDALDVHCSGYLLKPITEEKIMSAMPYLRHPLSEKPRVSFTCFGSFRALCDGAPIRFKYSKAQELLAYLVDRNCADVTTREAMRILFGEESRGKESYFGNIRLDLLDTLAALGERDIIRQRRGRLAIRRELVCCDYYDYLEGREGATFRGEYMTQYPFGKDTLRRLQNGEWEEEELTV